MTPADRDAGSGTVLVVAVVAVVLVLAGAVGLLARAQAARSLAQGGADLAALAAASSLSPPSGVVIRAPGTPPGDVPSSSAAHAGARVQPGAPGGACRLAVEVARRNGALVTACTVLPRGVVHVATSRATVLGPARAVARAGPASARSP